MEVHETIRKIREINQFTQEEVAERLGISVNGYSKIERGKTKITLDKLEQIAELFKMNVADLYSAKEKGFVYFLSEHHGSNYYQSDNQLLTENRELKLAAQYKDEIIEKLTSENKALTEIVSLLKEKIETYKR